MTTGSSCKPCIANLRQVRVAVVFQRWCRVGVVSTKLIRIITVIVISIDEIAFWFIDWKIL